MDLFLNCSILHNMVRPSIDLIRFHRVRFLLVLELSITPSLNSRLIPPHIQGTHLAAAAAAATAAGTTSASTNAAGTGATGGPTSGNSTGAVTTEEKANNSTSRTNQSPPPSMVPDGSTVNVHGPTESETMTSLDDPTTASVDSIAKDRS